ncbi:unnamed protein product [Acanthoscelides obtectus]|uniref:Uncharacterized protein n=1 Tax=Acanthoscelides obtectus TaxID=200917 RepID=A0A9P0P2T5_ACAOB|nr:unnamed protein product [Acanthoscelides obtectus]CAK1660318.1 hypothetical protein AOBTE_LOCUS21986 [Acanthoscelides obtectus]
MGRVHSPGSIKQSWLVACVLYRHSFYRILCFSRVGLDDVFSFFFFFDGAFCVSSFCDFSENCRACFKFDDDGSPLVGTLAKIDFIQLAEFSKNIRVGLVDRYLYAGNKELLSPNCLIRSESVCVRTRVILLLQDSREVFIRDVLLDSS